jgi:serine/threonine protein kinase
VIGTISRGAFGKVYKVVKKDTNEIYALKVLSKSQVQ